MTENIDKFKHFKLPKYDKEKELYYENEKIIKEKQNKYIEKYIKENKNFEKKLIRRFFTKVNIKGNYECWLWRNSVDGKGYGSFRFNEKIFRAHRVSYLLHDGEIPKNKFNICHICDNILCVNPKHLFPCTQKENIEDMLIKNRGKRSHPGEMNPNVIITLEQVNECREKYKKGKSIIILSKEYNMSWGIINSVVKNISWYDKIYQKWLRENDDIIIKGTSGEKNGMAKLTWENINNIRELWKSNKYSHYKLSKMYNVSRIEIIYITQNKRWYSEEYQRWIDNK